MGTTAAAHDAPIDLRAAFAGREILLTGANGFLGKVILGYFLERIPGAGKLHILVRPRAGVTSRERFERDVLTSPALAPIVERIPPGVLEQRIEIHSGDISLPNCGLPDATLDSLNGRVDAIINCAGLVEFFPPVDESFRSNVDGVEQVIRVARRLRAKLLHVSTCYVCGESDGLVEESEPIEGFYPHRRGQQDHSFDFRNEIDQVRAQVREIRQRAEDPNSKETLQRLVDLGTERARRWGWVNVYTYAKSLGEQLLAAEPGLDFSIVRPAIVEAAVSFPFPGWVEGGRTAAPLVMMAMGGLRHWSVRPEAPLEVVPVDFVAAGVITATGLLLRGRAERVYQLGTADSNPILLGPLVDILHREFRRSKRKLLPSSVRVLSPERMATRRNRLRRRLRAGQSAANGLKRRMERFGLPGSAWVGKLSMAFRMLDLQALFREQTQQLYQPFMHDNRFIFEAENIRRARALVSEADRELFRWSPESIDWERYWVDHEIRGVEKWVAPEVMKHVSFQV